jgi:hypothetical protein
MNAIKIIEIVVVVAVIFSPLIAGPCYYYYLVNRKVAEAVRIARSKALEGALSDSARAILYAAKIRPIISKLPLTNDVYNKLISGSGDVILLFGKVEKEIYDAPKGPFEEFYTREKVKAIIIGAYLVVALLIIIIAK